MSKEQTPDHILEGLGELGQETTDNKPQEAPDSGKSHETDRNSTNGAAQLD